MRKGEKLEGAEKKNETQQMRQKMTRLQQNIKKQTPVYKKKSIPALRTTEIFRWDTLMVLSARWGQHATVDGNYGNFHETLIPYYCRWPPSPGGGGAINLASEKKGIDSHLFWSVAKQNLPSFVDIAPRGHCRGDEKQKIKCGTKKKYRT